VREFVTVELITCSILRNEFSANENSIVLL
jgi:hypothetical protein